MIKGSDIRNAVNEAVRMTESYVSSPKEYELATELLSRRTKDAHEKLYKHYIEKLNRVSAQLDTVDRSTAAGTSAYRSLKQAEVYNRNAVYLHELYFANISDIRSELSYDNIVYMRLARDFGTFDDWQRDFLACGLSAKNGWVVTAYDTFIRKYVNFFIDDHDQVVPVGVIPVIVVDVFEHAYYRDYLSDKDKYIANMMREFNWKIIEKRLERAEAAAKALGA